MKYWHCIRMLKEVDGVEPPAIDPNCLHVFHLFVAQVENREKVADALGRDGVATGLHYPIPLHLQNAYAHLNISGESYPVAEAHAKRLISLPMFPELTEARIDHVRESLKRAVDPAAK